MKLPTKVRYAVRLAAELADRETSVPVPVKVLADAQGISPKYVKQLMDKLRQAGLVTGYPGVRGGFRLARASAEISLLDIYGAMEGTVCLVPCVNRGGRREKCERLAICPASDFWQDLTRNLETWMGKATIDQLARRGRSLRKAGHRVPQGAPAVSSRRRE